MEVWVIFLRQHNLCSSMNMIYHINFVIRPEFSLQKTQQSYGNSAKDCVVLFPKQSQNLDPSYKICLGRKTLSCKRINMVTANITYTTEL